MNFRTETYMGFMIRAYAYPSPHGYLPAAIVALASDVEREFQVYPPAQTFDQADQAVETAICWARDRVDELFNEEHLWRVH